VVAATGDAAERLFDLCPDPLAVSDFDGYFLRLNAAWIRVLGWSQAELTGRPYIEFVHPDDVASTEQAGERLLAGDQVTRFENRFRHRDGGYRWLSWDASADLAERRMYAAVRDVTEGRRLEVVEAELEAITGVGTWSFDVDSAVVHWSPLTHALHGTDPATFRPTIDDALRFYAPASRAALEQAITRLVDDGIPYDLELAFLPDGPGPRWVRATATGTQRAGRVVRAYGTFRDVTAEVEERARLARFRDLVELSEEGIVDVAADGRITYANQRMASMLGVDDPADLHGRTAEELAHPDDAEPARAWLEGIVTSGDEVGRGELRVRARGEDRWAQLAVRIDRGPGEGAGTATAVVTDITALKRRERDLEEARALLEEAQRLARIGHWRADVGSDALELSPVAEEVVADGPAPTTLAGYLALVHPDDRTLIPSRLSEIPIDRPLDVVHRLQRPGSRPRTVNLRASVELGDDGRIQAMRGTVQDVSDLHETERTLQRVLRATNDGWWDEDYLAGTVYYSHRWWELHGLTPPEGPVSRRTWRRLVPEEELVAIDARFAEVVAARQPTVQFRARVRHAAGHLVPVVVRAAIEYGEDGRVARVTGATRDVSPEVRTAYLQDVFISNVSHELRTPLTAIGGALDLFRLGRGGPLSKDGEDLLEVARRNTERLRALIADLLDLEQLAIGSVNLQLEVQPLAPIVEAALRDIEPYGESREVRFGVADPLDEVRVQVDAARIGQVLANYLSNAAKYAPAGSTVQVATDTGARRVRVSVRDTGPGVPAAFRDRAFERFAQADPDDPRSRGGTGLGLAISREIVLRHGGEVGYASRPGDTTFWFEVPLVR